MQNTKFAMAILAATLAVTTVSFGQTAPDATTPGPYTTTSSEYKLPQPPNDPLAEPLVTEFWARIYRPMDLSNAPYPVLIFLHGNHATCGRFEGAGPGRF